MLLVAIAFVVLILIGMPVAFAIGISGALFFLQHPELPFTIPIQQTVSQTEFRTAGDPLVHHRRKFHEQIRHHRAASQSGLGDRRPHAWRAGADVSCAVGPDGWRFRLGDRRCGNAEPNAGSRDDRPGPFERLHGGSALFRRDPDADHPAGTGLHHIRHDRAGLDRQAFRSRLRAGLPALVALAITVAIVSRRRGYARAREKPATLGEAAGALRGGIWALLFPVILLAGLRFGIFTPSEIGAFAVLYAVFIGALVYRKLRARNFLEAMDSSLADVGAVMFLIALSAVFTYGIVIERIPEVVSNAILGITDSLPGVLMLIVLFTLICGFFIDATVLIIMLTPIFLPLVRQLGGDPVHSGVVFIVAGTIGNFTPPVGAAMYAVCSILKVRIGEYTRESAPLFLAVAAVSLLLIFVPQIVLFLPNLLFDR